MAAHRYWRINVHDCVYGNYTSIAELVMASSVGGASLFGSGTPSASSTYGGVNGAVANAIDGNINTTWVASSNAAWWAYDFGAANAVSVVEVTMTARSDYPTASPDVWDLQYSDDNTAWTTVQTFTSAAWTSSSSQTFDVAGGTTPGGTGALSAAVSPASAVTATLRRSRPLAQAIFSTTSAAGSDTPTPTPTPTPTATHRYWRIYIDSLQPGTGLTNVELDGIAMAASNGGANQVVWSGVVYGAAGASASSFYPGYANPGVWLSADLTLPCWWSYDFGTPTKVVEVRFAAANLTFGDAAGPATWDLQYSDDNAVWTTLMTFVPATWTGTGASQTFEIAQGLLSIAVPGYAGGSNVQSSAVGNAGVTVPLTFNVRYLSQQLPVREIQVNWAVTGSAYDGSLTPAAAANFAGGVFPSGTVVFPPGSGGPFSEPITVTAAGDVPPAAYLGFAVTLSNPVNGTISATLGVAYGEMYNPTPTPTPNAATIADLWFAHTLDFVDLTVESNRRAFVSYVGGAEQLGVDGSVPFGVTPPVFLTSNGTPSSFATNQGRGGAFILSGGTLSAGASNPPSSSQTVTVPQANSPGSGVLGDYRNGNLYAFNPDTLTDNGTQRRWLRRWRALAQGSPAAKRFASLWIDIQTGLDVPDGTRPQVSLRWSDDGGATWSDERIVAVGQRGQTSQTLKFNRLGSTRRFGGSDRIFELSSVDLFMVAILGAEVDVS